MVAKRRTEEPPVAGAITALTARQAGSERVAVYLGGKRAFDLATAVVTTAGLRVGDRLEPGDRERLLEQDAPYRGREKALRLLAARDYSSQEMRVRLRQAFGPETVEEVLAWLLERDYLSDSRFAAAYAATKARAGWGERRIAAELARKGVPRRVAGEALDQLASVEDEAAQGIQRIVDLARRRFGPQLERDPQGAARRLAGFLGRRGYDWDVINSVLRELRADSNGENGPLP